MLLNYREVAPQPEARCAICLEALEEDVIAHEGSEKHHPMHSKCVEAWIRAQSSLMTRTCAYCHRAINPAFFKITRLQLVSIYIRKEVWDLAQHVVNVMANRKVFYCCAAFVIASSAGFGITVAVAFWVGQEIGMRREEEQASGLNYALRDRVVYIAGEIRQPLTLAIYHDFLWRAALRRHHFARVGFQLLGCESRVGVCSSIVKTFASGAVLVSRLVEWYFSLGSAFYLGKICGHSVVCLERAASAVAGETSRYIQRWSVRTFISPWAGLGAHIL